MGMDVGNSCTTVWIYLMPLNYTFRNGKFYVCFDTIKKKKEYMTDIAFIFFVKPIKN